MNSDSSSQTTALLVVMLIWSLVGIGMYVWYAFALSRLFPKLGSPGWKGWVPVVNEMEILTLGGVAAWMVVLYAVPVANIFMRIKAASRINAAFGRGTGMTVLAVLVSPLWATILASSRPISAASRIAPTMAYGGVAPHPHPEAHSSTQQSGLAAPAGQAPAGGTPAGGTPAGQMHSGPASLGSLGAIMGGTGAQPGAGEFAPPLPTPPTPSAPEGTAMEHNLRISPYLDLPSPVGPPVDPPAPPAPPAFLDAPAPPAPPAFLDAPAPPAPPAFLDAPAPPAPPAFLDAPAPPAPPAFLDAPAPADAAPVAPADFPELAPADFPELAPADAAPVAPADAAPVAPADAAKDDTPAPIVVHNPWAPRPAETSPTPSVALTTVTAPPPPPAPVTPVAPLISAELTPLIVPASVAPPAPPVLVDPLPQPPVTVVADDDDDDDGETVIVDRRPRIQWRLSVDGAGDFPLTGESVLLGRKPTSTNGTQALAIPDTTRTLSKVHARLDLVDGAWVITDLNSTNGVVISAPDGAEHLLTPGEAVAVSGAFILGKVAMSVGFEGSSS